MLNPDTTEDRWYYDPEDDLDLEDEEYFLFDYYPEDSPAGELDNADDIS